MLAFRVIHFPIVFNFLYWIFYTLKMIHSVEIKYIGCYNDDEDSMLDDIYFSRQLTLEVCENFCHRHRYLGLQYSYQCFCGDFLGDPDVYYKTSDNECNRKCAGNWSQICGGPLRNSVYEFITATVPTTEMTTSGHSTVKTTKMTTSGHSTVKTTEMTTPGHSTVKTKEAISPRQKSIMTTPGLSTVKTTEQTTLGQSELTSTDMTKPRQSTKTTSQITKHVPFKVTTTEITTIGQPKVTTTDMAIPGKSSVTNTQISKNEATKVTTTEIATLGQLQMITTDMKMSGQLSVTTLQVTEPRATIKTTQTFIKSEVISVQQTTPLECQCPCSSVVKRKWDFLRGMNLSLDQLRKLMKPELDLMTKELSVNKSNTTRMKRSKMSAPDDRGSATSVGYVGVVFICFIAVLIVFFDILGCIEAKLKRRS